MKFRLVQAARNLLQITSFPELKQVILAYQYHSTLCEAEWRILNNNIPGPLCSPAIPFPLCGVLPSQKPSTSKPKSFGMGNVRLVNVRG